jgi:L-2-aminoadipate reductase
VALSRSGATVSEADDLEGSRKGLTTGYGQSKWASEFVVREAGRRGLVGAVIRPGYVTGDPTTGVTVTDDFLVRLWKAALQVGARPDIANTVNTVPVTQVARIAVAAALHLPAALAPSSTFGVVQVNSRPRLTLNDWIGALEAYGYAVPAVGYDEWRTRVKEYVGAGGAGVLANGAIHGTAAAATTPAEEFALLPLFHYVVGDLPSDTVAPELDDANAAAVLGAYVGAKSGDERVMANGTTAANGIHTEPLAGNVVDLETLGMYFAYLVAVGFLPAPPPGKDTRRELPAVDAERLRSLVAGGLGGRSAKS